MMKSKHHQASPKQTDMEELPSLLKHVASRAVLGFDYDELGSGMASQACSPNPPSPPSSFVYNGTTQSTGADGCQSEVNGFRTVQSTPQPEVWASQSSQHAVSISMPTSPLGLRMEAAGPNGVHGRRDIPAGSSSSTPRRSNNKSYSQPMPAGAANGKTTPRRDAPDRRFDSFKTWSGRLERQISNLRGRPPPPPPEPQADAAANPEPGALPVDRYFDALQGPELDVLKPSEESALPEDKQWPFLLRFPVSSFGICLGVSSQAILWKNLATSPSTSFLRVSRSINFALWCVSLELMACVSLVYSLKIIFYFEAVRREYYHPIRVNFFFAPWISCLFLSIGVPPPLAPNLHAALWYALMAPILCLELKIYGQWMSGGQRRLSKVANPSNHLSIVGNFVGALLGASMGLREGPIFFFAVGLAHYTVLFVTLYQRLPTNETLPKELHPVFFLFVAVPSIASMAWAKLQGEFDYVSRIAYFISLFLYASLAVRINFFRGFRFSLAWWAYTFPMTGAAIATITYATAVRNVFTQSLAVALSAISTFIVTALLVSTIIHAFVLRDLFPNDVSIAVTGRRTKARDKCIPLTSPGPEKNEGEDSVSMDVQENNNL
ncbi:hypothetical protein Taro_015388 [Colocasia esculenta]|uniref:Uncharacterized protein n=1 Tax=Colocasia esculenta TaxID=4460 RepID=A0A843UHM5_COLES|nr:hypothetical protein [Colocasia esculenta]